MVLKPKRDTHKQTNKPELAFHLSTKVSLVTTYFVKHKPLKLIHSIPEVPTAALTAAAAGTKKAFISPQCSAGSLV